MSGSKNAALYALAAALLTAEPVVLRNVPEIADIGEMAEVLRDLGAAVSIDGTTVSIEARELTKTVADAERVAALRASFLVMGPLLARLGEAACPPPGGDVIGSRPLDVHFAGFKALGAAVTREGAAYVARSPRLQGTRIFFDYPSVLGTVNVIFAATLAQGTTTIINAAAEPEVEMACDLLNAMGARITDGGNKRGGPFEHGVRAAQDELTGSPRAHGSPSSLDEPRTLARPRRDRLRDGRRRAHPRRRPARRPARQSAGRAQPPRRRRSEIARGGWSADDAIPSTERLFP